MLDAFPNFYLGNWSFDELASSCMGPPGGPRRAIIELDQERTEATDVGMQNANRFVVCLVGDGFVSLAILCLIDEMNDRFIY